MSEEATMLDVDGYWEKSLPDGASDIQTALFLFSSAFTHHASNDPSALLTQNR